MEKRSLRAFVARDGETYLRVGVAEFLTPEGRHPWEIGRNLTNEELAEDEDNYLDPREGEGEGNERET